MDTINSSDYHDYVIKNGKFIGQFDQMYRNVADPWHQDEDGLSDKEPLRVLALQEMVKIKPVSILDIGCGLGFFTNQMQLVTGASVLGVDISSTAVSKAVARYPNCRFESRSISQICGIGSKFDLIVASELLWYVLPEINRFFEDLKSVAHDRTYLYILQYFPPVDEQQYGRDVLLGVEGLVRLLPFRIVKSIEINRLLPRSESDRQGKTGSHRVLLMCDRITRSHQR